MGIADTRETEKDEGRRCRESGIILVLSRHELEWRVADG